MDNIPQPNTIFKDRRGGLIAFGVFQLLIAACLFLLAAFMLFIPAAELAKSQPPGAPPPPMEAAAALYGVMGAVFAALGIGSILAKNWARIGTLIVCWFWLGIGVISMLVEALVLPSILRNSPPAQQNLPGNFGHTVVMVVLIFGALFGVVLPGIFLLFYHSKNVRATVLQGQATASQRPVLMTILIVWFSLAALSIFFPLLAHYPVIVFGIIPPSWMGKAIFVISSILYGLAAWAYARSDVRGWWLALGSQVFWMVSAIVGFSRGNLVSLYRQMGMSEQQLQPLSTPYLLNIGIGIGLFVMTMTLIAVIYSKRYFPSSPPSEAGQLT